MPDQRNVKTVGADQNSKQDAPTIVLPGPGRYLATVLPDGAMHLHETKHHPVLEEMTPADCRVLCHTLKIIEDQKHTFQHRRSVASDQQDEFELARVEVAILDGAQLADRCLRWHSGFEKDRVCRANLRCRDDQSRTEARGRQPCGVLARRPACS